MNGTPEVQTSEDAQGVNPITGIRKNVQNNIPYGYCQCGCGQKTKISPKNHTDRKWVKGQPRKYLAGHHTRVKPTYSKGGIIKNNGYIQVRIPHGYYPYHRFLVERIWGKELPAKAVVHHHNEKGTDNSHGNLVVCEDNAYHMLLHQRQRAYNACGHADWRKCRFCKQYDSLNNLYIKGAIANHRHCMAKYARERRKDERNSKI